MYQSTPNWSYLFYPPPYNFLAPPATSAKPGTLAPEDVLQPMGTGMGCNGLGCTTCGGTCGVGQTSSGLFGTGLFQSADPTTWGIGEWSVIGIGGFLAISAVNTSQTAARGVRKAYRRATT
jgi:hypothetical protein